MPGKVKLKKDSLKKLMKLAGSKPTSYLVLDGVEYGVNQEFGETGHPSARPAFEQVTRELPKQLGRAIESMQSFDEVARLAALRMAVLWSSDVNVDTGAYRDSIHVEKR